MPADPNNKSSHPTKLDHFYFTKKSPKGEWVKDEELTKTMEEQYGAPVREFDVVLLTDSVEEAFSSEYAWWSKSEKKCSGNGREAFRRTSIIKPEDLKPIREKHPELFLVGEVPALVPWAPCGDTCPDLKEGKCKPSGQLVFMLKDRPKLGAVCTYYTTSYQTVAELHSSLTQIHETSRGRLKYIPMRMSLRPGTTRYQDADGKARKGNAFFVHLEFREDDHRKLLSSLVRQSLVFDQAQAIQDRGIKLLGEGNVRSQIIEDVENLAESETAAILSGEFYGDDAAEVVTETAKDVKPETTQKQADQGDAAFETSVKALGLTKAQRDMVLARFQGDLGTAGEFLKQLGQYRDALGADAKRVSDWISQGVQNPEALIESLRQRTATEGARAAATGPQPDPSKPAESKPAAPKAAAAAVAAAPAVAASSGPPDPEPPPQARRSARSQEKQDKKKDSPAPRQEAATTPPPDPTPPPQKEAPKEVLPDRGGEPSREASGEDLAPPPPPGDENWDGW